MGHRTWRLGSPPQALVFRFTGVTALCGAVAALYRRLPQAAGRLCLYQGRYYLAVQAGLAGRPRARKAAGGYGDFLGPARVLYAYCEEHGRTISQNAVVELGAALDR